MVNRILKHICNRKKVIKRGVLVIDMTNCKHFVVRRFWIVNFAVICIILVIIFNVYVWKVERDILFHKNLPLQSHEVIVKEFYARNEFGNLSKLGDVLFKNQQYPQVKEKNRNKTFIILIWMFWERLQKRHVYYLGSDIHDPLSGCSVRNCEFTGDNATFYTADAVLIHIYHGLIPSMENRNRNQRWIFLNDEAPPRIFRTKIKPPLSSLYNVFNWSMTYQTDADVPAPSGRTVPLKKPRYSYPNPPIAELIPYWKQKRHDVLISIMMSNCYVPYLKRTIKTFKEFLELHVYGKCGDKKLKDRCPNHFQSDCEDISHYLFYLALENSKCRGYLTEKIFHNAYSKGAIPVINGPTVDECLQLLPPNSFLHISMYTTVKDLTDDILKISNDEKLLLSFHQWRNHFEVLNEHGYFGTRSFHLCRLCEAMNYNDEDESIYDEKKLKHFLGTATICRLQ